MDGLLARSRRLRWGALDFETPLLVPSLSSKADQPWGVGTRKETEVVPVSQVHSSTFLPALTDEAVLVSAYDIFHGNLHQAAALRGGFRDSIWAGPRLIILDSGWYEKGIDGLLDSQSAAQGTGDGAASHDSTGFDYQEYREVVESLDEDFIGLVVGWDSRGAYEEQIDKAQEFFADRNFASCLLLKPTGERETHDFTGLSQGTASRLRHFDVVGATEKELGDSVLSRLSSVWELRTILDRAEVDAPIHVFGGLDPLMTPLYYAAGAEIFDGLAWLRYAFVEGLAVHREAPIVLNRLSDKRIAMSISKVQLDNLDFLRELKRQMKVFWHRGGDWQQYRRGDVLEAHFDALLAEGGIRGR